MYDKTNFKNFLLNANKTKTLYKLTLKIAFPMKVAKKNV